jgi:ABC-2 type transport system ATP-binding protein
MTMISIDKLSKTFVTGIRRTRKKAVDQVSFNIESGEIFGIIGVNGAGKSSILKMVLGFIYPDSGTILVSGKKPTDPLSRKHIGYLPENPYFYDHLTAEELLKFGVDASGLDRSTARTRIDELLDRVNLLSEKKQKLRSFSKGMTQRAGICFALIHDPQVVILDEPMSGLDPVGRKMVIELILDLKARGKTVLFCSHILSDVERICDRVAIMDQGRAKTLLTREDIFSRKKQVDVWINKMTNSLIQRLKNTPSEVTESKVHVKIQCPEEYIDNLFTVLKEEGVRVVHINTSLNPMEHIFLETIGEKK